MSTSPVHPIPTAAGLSPSAKPEARATFGWRPGTIRGLLSLLVLALLWSIPLFSPQWKRGQEIPLIYVYLQYLLVLIIAYYFPAHSGGSVSARERPLFRLWPEIVPWILVAGSIGLGAYMATYHHDLVFSSTNWNIQPVALVLAVVLLIGFFIGHAMTWLVSRLWGGRLPAWLQDLQAWIALLAIVGLAAELLIHTFVLPGLDDPQRRTDIQNTLQQWEGILAGVVAFYYGARTETPRVSS